MTNAANSSTPGNRRGLALRSMLIASVPVAIGLVTIGLAASPAPGQAARTSGILSEQLTAPIEKDGRLEARELDTIVATLAAADQRVADWLASMGATGLMVADAPAWLTDPTCPWPLANPLLLYAARTSALDERYQTALAWLDVRDASASRPADASPLDGESMALFYRAIALHQLVRLEEAIRAADALLALSDTARRHRHTARLIARNAKDVDEKSLDFVARLMGDSRRRLSLGEAGQAERDLQADILKRLDKQLEELEEKQRQQQQQQQAQAGRPSQGQGPMPESQPGELKGDGLVDKRGTPSGGDWGSLPPAERERVTQQIIRDFPGRYRRLIEQYFRSLADPDAEDAPATAPAREAVDR